MIKKTSFIAIVDILKFRLARLLFRSNSSKYLNVYSESRKLLCQVVESNQLTESNRAEARDILRQIDEAVNGSLSMPKMLQLDAVGPAPVENRGSKRSRDEEDDSSRKRLAPAGMHV